MLTHKSFRPVASGLLRPCPRRNVLATCLSGNAKAKGSNPTPQFSIRNCYGDVLINAGEDARVVEWDAVAITPEAKALLQQHAVKASAALKMHTVLGFEDVADLQRLTPDLIARLELKPLQLDNLLHMLQQQQPYPVTQPLGPHQLHGSKEDKGLNMDESGLQQEKLQQQQQKAEAQKEQQEKHQEEEQQRHQKEQKSQQQLQQQERENHVFVKAVERIGKRCWAIAPDGRRAVSSSENNALEVWNVATGTLIATIDRKEKIILPVAASEMPTAASGVCDFTLHVWGQAYAAGLHRGPFMRALSLAISPDGRTAVSGSADRGVWLWDLDAYECIGALTQHRGSVNAVAISPDGRRAVSGSDDKTVRLWDLATRTCIATLEGHTGGVLCVAITPDGRRAVSGSDDKMLRIWDLDTCTCVAAMQEPAQNSVTCVAITPDGRHAVTGSSHRVMSMWDLATNACVATMAAQLSSMASVIISPDGRHAVFSTVRNEVELWDLAAYLDAAAV